MTDEERTARVAELWELRHSDPLAVLALYRCVAGLSANDMPPPGVIFSDMIQAIVEKEAAA
jgi:hypothetical protein